MGDGVWRTENMCGRQAVVKNDPGLFRTQKKNVSTPCRSLSGAKQTFYRPGGSKSVP